jgi:hypothetical protein
MRSNEARPNVFGIRHPQDETANGPTRPSNSVAAAQDEVWDLGDFARTKPLTRQLDVGVDLRNFSRSRWPL